MQFKVPQFLDIEDKIFGPFTFSEFVYLAGGGGVCFIIYRAMGPLLGAIPILMVAGLAAALVFYKPNNKPFIEMIESAFKYVFQYKLYIWKRSPVKKQAPQNTELPKMEKVSMHVASPQRLGGEKLRDLAWSLDVLDLKKEEQ